MITWVCITFVMFILVCVVAVCVHFAKDGLEDGDGFHFTETSPLEGSGPVLSNREMNINLPPAKPVTAPLKLAAETE